VRHDLADHVVHRGARLDHQHDAARALQQRCHFFNRVRADNLRAFGFVVHEVIDLGDGPVKDHHFVSVVVHVQHEILTHHGQPDKTDIASCLWHIDSLWNYRATLRFR